MATGTIILVQHPVSIFESPECVRGAIALERYQLQMKVKRVIMNDQKLKERGELE